MRVPDVSRLKPEAPGTAPEVTNAVLKRPREDSVGVVFEGYFHGAAAGTDNFTLACDDGSKLNIDGKTIVDNDGDHGVITASGKVDLQPGKHAIRVEWFNGGGGAWLGAYFEGPGIPRQVIDPNLLTPR